MELALYHPIHGYYSAPGPQTGKRGDYLTSPEISPLFGECIARYLAGRGIAAVREIGPGSGKLGEVLGQHFSYTTLVRGEPFPRGFEGAVVSNELLDALPVHRLRDGQEVFVREDLTEELLPADLGTSDGEVNTDALDLMRTVYEGLSSGLVLTIDYGYEAHQRRATFRTYFRHTVNDNPYELVGYKDMTSHVDFTAITQLGESCGLRTELFTTQADFLAANGIGEMLVARPDFLQAKQAVMELLNPAGMGAFRVLVQVKDLPV
ncbi:MAG: SAM-dependent methyltransferase [Chloroflexi bacterium]|nr:SAM-dependent methyltransferase [Chloroflexota bacterium]